MTWIGESAFRRGLIDDHHDELAFLYRQIAHHRDEGTLDHTRLAELEWRLVAHLDGLKIGGEATWREIGSRHDPDDPGHWYAAALLACARRDDARHAALMQRASGHAAAPAALADALRHAMPSAWDARFAGWLAELPQPALGWFADVASFRLPASGDALVRRLHGERIVPTVELVRAVGRLRAAGGTEWLAACVQTTAPGDDVHRAALLALAEAGAPQALDLMRASAGRSNIVHPLLGVAGRRADVGLLLQRLSAEAAPHTALGLGLLGDPGAVRPLVDLLDHDACGDAAAQALEWITGAGLVDDVADDDDAQAGTGDPPPDRPPRWRAGAPRLPRPAARTHERPSRDRTRWLAWLEDAAPRFRSGMRYRYGQAYTLPWLLQTLADTARPMSYRRHAVDELAIRHAPPRRLDPRGASARWLATLRELDAWARADGTTTSATE